MGSQREEIRSGARSPVNELQIVPLGGLGEVGKNMMAVEYGQDILVVDAGLMFPESDMFGVDYIIPDYGYLRDKRDRVRAIVITHGHEDHIGAAPPFPPGVSRPGLRHPPDAGPD